MVICKKEKALRTGATCEGRGTLPYAKPGFWGLEQQRTLFLECPSPESCLGGNSTVLTKGCDTATTGRACQYCNKNHFNLFGSCMSCSEGRFASVVGNLALAFAIGLAWIFINFVLCVQLDTLDTFLSTTQVLFLRVGAFMSA